LNCKFGFEQSVFATKPELAIMAGQTIRTMKFLANIKRSIPEAREKKYLNLSEFQLYDKDIPELLSLILPLKLKTLILEHNNIGSFGAIQLVTQLTTLEFLDLAYNNVADDAIDDLIASPIKELNLKRNNFTDQGARKFIGADKKIHLEHNQLSTEIMGQVMQQNASFSRFRMR
jgi:hypothetical protein